MWRTLDIGSGGGPESGEKMPSYDVMNGLASADPIVFLIGLGLVMLFGWLVSRKDKR
ncbi:MAG TPA: hypothetical protein VK139_07925 [Microbacteriaceae bacterium]|nr:hypothetical protein [Microbacteriaceae bacterium]